MSGLLLAPADRAQLLALMRRQTPSTVHRRMNALLLLDDGWTAERVAEVLFIDAETVRQYRRLYEADGLTGLRRLGYEGSEPALNPAQLSALAAELEARLYATAKAVCAFVRRTYTLDDTAHAMAKLLKRQGFVYKKPKGVPAKADAETQQRFFAETLAPLLAKAGAASPVYFTDAAHPAYTAHQGYGWIARARPASSRATTAGSGSTSMAH
jgi:transposase